MAIRPGAGAGARLRVHRRGAARALPVGDDRGAAPLVAGRRRLVRPQPGAGGNLALPLQRRQGRDSRRVQPGPPRRRDDGALPGGGGAAAGSAAVRRPRHRVGAGSPARARRLGRVRRRRAGRHRRHGAASRRTCDPPRGDGRRALRRRAGADGALPADPDRAVGRGARDLRRRPRRARARRLLQVLHRRGLLGPGPYAPGLPRRRLGRDRGPDRRLPGDLARRRRGPLAADPRPLGRLRPGRDGLLPRSAAGRR